MDYERILSTFEPALSPILTQQNRGLQGLPINHHWGRRRSNFFKLFNLYPFIEHIHKGTILHSLSALLRINTRGRNGE